MNTPHCEVHGQFHVCDKCVEDYHAEKRAGGVAGFKPFESASREEAMPDTENLSEGASIGVTCDSFHALLAWAQRAMAKFPNRQYAYTHVADTRWLVGWRVKS